MFDLVNFFHKIFSVQYDNQAQDPDRYNAGNTIKKKYLIGHGRAFQQNRAKDENGADYKQGKDFCAGRRPCGKIHRQGKKRAKRETGGRGGINNENQNHQPVNNKIIHPLAFDLYFEKARQ